MNRDELAILGDKTSGYMSSDVTGVVVTAVHCYYQEVFKAEKFIERKHDNDNLTYEPCSIHDPQGKIMDFKDFEPHQLYKRKLSFECLQQIISKSRPSIEFQEINKSRWFEMKHPTVTISNLENTINQTISDPTKKREHNKGQASLFRSIKQKIKKPTFNPLSNAEKPLSLKEMEARTLCYLNQIAEITTDKTFSSLASQFSNMMKKVNEST
jgi:hypothetical protein